MDDTNRLALLDVLGLGQNRFDACALARCLMGNHHFVTHDMAGQLVAADFWPCAAV
ncbi:MAG: hypothetical protein Q7J58_10735 [Hydrogenophaga sp.]|uniref:hypothetical protein n=1 Tax=Hydrogenophaga sp. TaxID=1904254 RepID=UPI0027267926|nr:hypothetical protein [Hydrogenophaga sp.]MDO9569842.1 hypothetical protein [Hydrogenophaga sp.]